MKHIVFVAFLFLIGTFSQAQDVLLKGEQKVNDKNSIPELICTPIKITKPMKIEEVTGNCNGFWLQKGSTTVSKYKNMTDPVGTIISPGTYYVYPFLKEGEKKADVTLKLKNKTS